MKVLPWHQQAWARWVETHQRGRLAHAYLLHARPGFGRDEFARTFVAGLLCAHPLSDGHACGVCARCGWYQAQSHPDVLEVHPSGASETITVDSIREAANFMTLSAQENSWKTVLVFRAERLNTFAANSLLKTLEEPPARGLLVLMADTPTTVLATLRSRCQLMDVGHCDLNTAQAWLAPQLGPEFDANLLLGLTQGAPAAALELAQSNTLDLRQQLVSEYDTLMRQRGDPMVAAAAWLTRDVVATLGWLRSWYADMIRMVLAPGTALYNPDIQPVLAAIAPRIPVRRLFVDYDSICQALRLHRTNVNTHLVLEDLLCGLTHPN